MSIRPMKNSSSHRQSYNRVSGSNILSMNGSQQQQQQLSYQTNKLAHYIQLQLSDLQNTLHYIQKKHTINQIKQSISHSYNIFSQTQPIFRELRINFIYQKIKKLVNCFSIIYLILMEHIEKPSKVNNNNIVNSVSLNSNGINNNMNGTNTHLEQQIKSTAKVVTQNNLIVIQNNNTNINNYNYDHDKITSINRSQKKKKSQKQNNKNKISKPLGGIHLYNQQYARHVQYDHNYQQKRKKKIKQQSKQNNNQKYNEKKKFREQIYQQINSNNNDIYNNITPGSGPDQLTLFFNLSNNRFGSQLQSITFQDQLQDIANFFKQSQDEALQFLNRSKNDFMFMNVKQGFKQAMSSYKLQKQQQVNTFIQKVKALFQVIKKKSIQRQQKIKIKLQQLKELQLKLIKPQIKFIQTQTTYNYDEEINQLKKKYEQLLNNYQTLKQFRKNSTQQQYANMGILQHKLAYKQRQLLILKNQLNDKNHFINFLNQKIKSNIDNKILKKITNIYRNNSIKSQNKLKQQLEQLEVEVDKKLQQQNLLNNQETPNDIKFANNMNKNGIAKKKFNNMSQNNIINQQSQISNNKQQVENLSKRSSITNQQGRQQKRKRKTNLSFLMNNNNTQKSNLNVNQNDKKSYQIQKQKSSLVLEIQKQKLKISSSQKNQQLQQESQIQVNINFKQQISEDQLQQLSNKSNITTNKNLDNSGKINNKITQIKPNKNSEFKQPQTRKSSLNDNKFKSNSKISNRTQPSVEKNDKLNIKNDKLNKLNKTQDQKVYHQNKNKTSILNENFKQNNLVKFKQNQIKKQKSTFYINKNKSTFQDNQLPSQIRQIQQQQSIRQMYHNNTSKTKVKKQQFKSDSQEEINNKQINKNMMNKENNQLQQIVQQKNIQQKLIKKNNFSNSNSLKRLSKNVNLGSNQNIDVNSRINNSLLNKTNNQVNKKSVKRVMSNLNSILQQQLQRNNSKNRQIHRFTSFKHQKQTDEQYKRNNRNNLIQINNWEMINIQSLQRKQNNEQSQYFNDNTSQSENNFDLNDNQNLLQQKWNYYADIYKKQKTKTNKINSNLIQIKISGIQNNQNILNINLIKKQQKCSELYNKSILSSIDKINDKGLKRQSYQTLNKTEQNFNNKLNKSKLPQIYTKQNQNCKNSNQHENDINKININKQRQFNLIQQLVIKNKDINYVNFNNKDNKDNNNQQYIGQQNSYKLQLKSIIKNQKQSLQTHEHLNEMIINQQFKQNYQSNYISQQKVQEYLQKNAILIAMKCNNIQQFKRKITKIHQNRCGNNCKHLQRYLQNFIKYRTYNRTIMKLHIENVNQNIQCPKNESNRKKQLPIVTLPVINNNILYSSQNNFCPNNSNQNSIHSSSKGFSFANIPNLLSKK